MKTPAEMLKDDAERLKANIRALLSQHSRLRKREESRGLLVLDPKGDHDWEDLSIEGRRLQTGILTDFRGYQSLVAALVRGLPGESLREFEDAAGSILDVVEQEHSTWCRAPQDAIDGMNKAFDSIQGILDRLCSSEGVSLVVPDTNALLANPDLDRWRFDWCSVFTIVLTPTILGELDEHKVSHKVPEVREKARSVIRRIKELGRRGDLQDGVSVVKDSISARSVAAEPKVSETLPWLDERNNDDRFLASVIELARDNTRSVVTIVTGDINLQNKARFARIPFCEPPEPGETNA